MKTMITSSSAVRARTFSLLPPINTVVLGFASGARETAGALLGAIDDG